MEEIKFDVKDWGAGCEKRNLFNQEKFTKWVYSSVRDFNPNRRRYEIYTDNLFIVSGLDDDFMNRFCIDFEKSGMFIKYVAFWSFTYKHKLIISKDPILDYVEYNGSGRFKSEHEGAAAVRKFWEKNQYNNKPPVKDNWFKRTLKYLKNI